MHFKYKVSASPINFWHTGHGKDMDIHTTVSILFHQKINIRRIVNELHKNKMKLYQALRFTISLK